MVNLITFLSLSLLQFQAQSSDCKLNAETKTSVLTIFNLMVKKSSLTDIISFSEKNSVIISSQSSNDLESLYKLYFTRGGTFEIILNCNDSEDMLKVYVSELVYHISFSTETNEIPSTTRDYFQILVNFPYPQLNHLKYDCSLTLVDTNFNENIKSQLLRTEPDDHCEFKNLMISQSGTFRIKVRIIVLDQSIEVYKTDSFTQPFNIKSSIENIEISQDSVNLFEKNCLILSVKGENNKDFLDGCTLTAVIGRNHLFEWNDHEKVLGNKKSFCIFANDTDDKRLVFQAASLDNSSVYNKTFSVKVTPAKIILDIPEFIYKEESNLTNPFDAMLRFQTASNKDIKMNELKEPVLLKLSLTNLSETLNNTLKIGKNIYPDGIHLFYLPLENPWKIENISISSSERFFFNITSENFFTHTASRVLQTNENNEEISNYFIFSIDVEISAGDNIIRATVKEKDTEILSMKATSFNLQKGSNKLDGFMFVNEGNVTIQVLSQSKLLKEKKYTVKRSNLYITSFTPPSSSESFNVSIEIRNFNNSKPLHIEFDFKVEVQLIPEGDHTGVSLTKIEPVLINNIFEFYNLQILSTGTFKLEFSCENLTSIYTDEFYVTNNLKLCKFTSNPQILAVFESFILKVEAIGEDDNPYKPKMTISCNNSECEENGVLDNYDTYAELRYNATDNDINLRFKVSGLNDDTIYCDFNKSLNKGDLFFEDEEFYETENFNLSFSLRKDISKILNNTNNITVNGRINCINVDKNLSSSQKKTNLTQHGIISFFNININYRANCSITLQSDSIFNLTTFNFSVQKLIQFEIKMIPEGISHSASNFSLNISSLEKGILKGNTPFKLIFENLTVCSNTTLNKNDSFGNQSTNNNGFYQIDHLRILSSGSFVFLVYYKDEIASRYKTNHINNTIQKFELKSIKNISYVNYPFFINFTLTGEDDSSYILPAKLTLYDISGPFQDRENFSTISHLPRMPFEISIREAKIYNFRLISDETKIVGILDNIAFLPNNIKVISNFDYLITVNDTTSLNISLSVYGEKEDEIESYYGIYNISINGSCANFPNKTLKTSQGKLNHTFFITDPGKCKLWIFTDSVLLSNFSKTLKVNPTLKEITYNTSSLSWPVNTLITLVLSLKTFGDYYYTNPSTIILICPKDSVILNNTSTTSTGNATFQLYFKSKSIYNCKARTLNKEIQTNLTFKIQEDRKNPEKKCLVEYNENTCFKCIPNAKKNAMGRCQCSKNSKYDESRNSCDCNQGFQSINDYCLICGRFFEIEEISAVVSEDFRKIDLEFAFPANTENFGNVENWVEAFSISGDLMKMVKSAGWKNSNLFQILFKKMIDVKNEQFLILDPFVFQKKDWEKCVDLVKDLKIEFNVTRDKPVPDFTLIAPMNVSSRCQNSFTVRTKTFNPIFKYKWASNEKSINKLLSNETSSSIIINIKNLTLQNKNFSNFEVNLTVTDVIFKTSSTKSVSIELVSNRSTFEVSFPQGQEIHYKTEEYLEIKPQIINSCGYKNFKYSWFLSKLGENPSPVKNKLKTSYPSMLLLKPGSLLPSTSYQLSVTVKYSKNIKSSASMIINVTSSQLVLSLNRASGNVSTLLDFDLTVKAYDPDNPNFKKFEYIWSTFDDSKKECKDKENQSLLTNNSLNPQIISRNQLKNNSFCKFQVVVKGEGKEAKTEVNIFFSESIEGEILMPKIPEFVNADEDFYIAPVLINKELQDDVKNGKIKEKEMKWEIEPRIDIAGDMRQQFLFIPKGTLKKGVNYFIRVSMKTGGNNNYVSSETSFYTSSPPICENFTVEVEKYQKNLRYYFRAVNCYDKDSGSDVFYQFGFRNEEKITWLTKLVVFDSVKLRISENVDEYVMRVCDNQFSCNNYSARIAENNKMRMVSGVKDNLMEDIQDIDEIPSLIIYYSGFIKDFNDSIELYKIFSKYFSSIELDSYTVDSLFSCLESIFNQDVNQTEYNHSKTIQSIGKFINETLKKYKKPLSIESFSKLWNVFHIFINYLSNTKRVEYIKMFTDYLMKNSIVNTSIPDDYPGLTRHRILGSSEKFEYFESSYINIKFPNNLNINKSSIYDLITYSYLNPYPIFEVSIKKVGNFTNGLDLLDIENSDEMSIISKTPIKIAIQGSFDTFKKYKCKYLESNDSWTENHCEVEEISENEIKLTVLHFSVYSIQEENFDCSIGFSPLIAMSSLIIIILLSFFCLGNSSLTCCKQPKEKSFKLLYPATSLFLNETVDKKSLIIIQMASSQMVLITLIGAFLYYFFEINEEKVSKFLPSHLKVGAVAWIISQIFIIPVFIMNTCLMNGRECKKCVLVFCGILDVICVVATVAMDLYFCEVWSFFWIFNWAVFAVLDFVTAQVFYAFVLNRLSGRLVKVDIFGDSEEAEIKNQEDEEYDDCEEVFCEFDPSDMIG